jgi:hypothetical protein
MIRFCILLAYVAELAAVSVLRRYFIGLWLCCASKLLELCAEVAEHYALRGTLSELR